MTGAIKERPRLGSVVATRRAQLLFRNAKRTRSPRAAMLRKPATLPSTFVRFLGYPFLATFIDAACSFLNSVEKAKACKSEKGSGWRPSCKKARRACAPVCVYISTTRNPTYCNV